MNTSSGRRRRGALLVILAVTAFAFAVACTPAAPASIVPASVTLPSAAASIVPSAKASGASNAPSPAASPSPVSAAQPAISALNKLDQVLTFNQTPTGLTVDELGSLRKALDTVNVRLEEGDLAAARGAFSDFKAKVETYAAKLNTDNGTRLRAAIKVLDALLPA